ncbi:hypothetical protein C3488_00350 [Streptomyces sp. Ru72]|nr:hypothetical protein C3488_00350 [Streptomyces sp. Ru72]
MTSKLANHRRSQDGWASRLYVRGTCRTLPRRREVVHRVANFLVDNSGWLWIKHRERNQVRDPRLSRRLER